MNDPVRLPWQEEHWARLVTSRHDARLPHAMLIRGPTGLGKAAFAQRLAAALVCATPNVEGDACGECAQCHQRRAGSHPDLHVLEPEAPGRPIKIDAVRGLTARSALAAQPAGFRVFIICPADAMNRAAANALLKTLEEPTPRTVLLLVSAHPDRLPGTIRSRCQSLTFRLPSASIGQDWLQQQLPGDSSERLEALLAMAGGAPLRALQAREEDWDAEGARLLDELVVLKQRKINPLQLVEKWEERSLTNITTGLKRLLSDLVRCATGLHESPLYHGSMRTELQSLSEGIDLQQIFRFVDLLWDAERSMSNNANPQMTLENLVNCWLKITRPGGR